MNPVSPVMPGTEIRETTFGAENSDYIPLKGVIMGKAHGEPVMTRWRLTDEEREKIWYGADVVLTLLTFKEPLMPIHMQVVLQDDLPGVEHLEEKR